jgi:uncharacterized membrane protein
MSLLQPATTALGGLVAAFSVTHIGLSAVREPLIETCGSVAERLNLVNTGLKLPQIWLADTNGLEIWPDSATAGRQVYRAFYTAVASALLFPALAAYPSVHAAEVAASSMNGATPEVWWAAFVAASAANGLSLTSLLQPSPLSLVPGFKGDDEQLLGLRRDDTLKLNAAGLTRITRHPLILPVVPWGLSNAVLTGGHEADLALFVGLAIYAVAGCKAQDLRVESSAQVGTVFSDGALRDFYRDTSFVPFGAWLDGRQSLGVALQEVPKSGLVASLLLGAAVEWATLQWIGVSIPPA